MSEPAPRSAVVVGAGVVGLTLAIALAERGVAVTLVGDEARWSGASWGNAGHIATEQVEPLASWANIRSLPRRLFARGGSVALPPGALPAWLPFGARLMAAAAPARLDRGREALRGLLAGALPAWRGLLDRAAAADLLIEDGHFLLWETPATAARGRAQWAAANTGNAGIRDADAAERAALAAMVTVPVAGAIRFDGTGRIRDLAALQVALLGRLAALGGRLRQGLVRNVGHAGAGVTLADGATLGADLVIVAAGARSGALLAPLGPRVPLIAERGYHLHGPAPDWPADAPPIVFEDRGVIVTRFDNGLRAAGFTEFARVDTPADPRKWARLQAHCADLGLPLATTSARWMGARPTLPDYLPALGRLPGPAGVAYAFGHQHLGLTLAAVSAERLADRLCGRPTGFALEAFDLLRFAR